jgi:hypothetical protein
MLAFPAKYCNVCGGTLTVHRVVHGFCEAAACRTMAGQRWVEKKKVDEQDAIQRVVNEYRDALLEEKPQLKAQGVAVLVVPGLDSSLQLMRESRRDTLRTHIEALLVEPASVSANVAATPGVVRDATTEKALAAACSTCRGFCCRKGGDSAYIDATTIARVRYEHPELNSSEIAAAYVHAVPESSVGGSCIFHGDQGCTLPRDFRATICNDYFCGALEAWLGKYSPQTSQAVAAVVIRDSQVIRSAQVSGALDADAAS